MRLCAFAHTFSVDLRVALERSRLAGFAGVVLDPAAFPGIVDPSRSAQREIVHLLARSNQVAAGIDARLGSAGLLPRAAPGSRIGGDIDREIDRVGRAIDIARGIGSTLVLCDLGPLPPAPDEPLAFKPLITRAALGALILPDMSGPPASAAVPVAREPAFEAAVDHALHAIGERADRAGCTVAYRAALGSFASLSAALARVDCPYFGIDLDPLALLADAWTLDAVFSRLGQHVRHVRGRDGLRGSTGRVIAAELGSGQLDWPTLLEALRDTDYRGDLTIDVAELPGRPADVALRGRERVAAWLA